jgi:hypothetical protein
LACKLNGSRRVVVVHLQQFALAVA